MIKKQRNYKPWILSIFIVFTMVFSGFIGFCSIAQEVKDEQKDETSNMELPELPKEGNYNYVVLADVNKDTYLDIVVSGAGRGGYYEAAPGGIHVYTNMNGTSFVNDSVGLPQPGGDNFHATHSQLQVIDINKDSNPDIVAAEWLSHQYESLISIYLGNGGKGGSMKWTPAEGPGLYGSWSGVACGDIDGDDHLDLVAGGAYGLNVWKGIHAGGVLNWTDASTEIPDSIHHVSGIKLADVNHDGRLDIVTGQEEGPGVQVYTCSETGDISWIEAHNRTPLASLKTNTWDVVLTDLNGDPHLDLIVTAKNGIRVFLGNGNSGDRSTWWVDVSDGLPTSGTYYQLGVGDIDNDGKTDISSALSVWSNSGDMADADSYSWKRIGIGLSEEVSVGLALGDLDKDGNTDIVSCGWETNNPGIHAYTNLTLGSDDSSSGGVPDSSIPGERVWFVKKDIMEKWTPRPNTKYIFVAMIGWEGILVENTKNGQKIGFENMRFTNSMGDDTAKTIMRNDWKTVFVIYDDGSRNLHSLNYIVDSDPLINPYGWPYILEVTYFDGNSILYVNTTDPENNVVISRGSLHRFNIDWTTVKTGNISGVQVDIDADGDGEYESAMIPAEVKYNVQIEGPFGAEGNDKDQGKGNGEVDDDKGFDIVMIMLVGIVILIIVIVIGILALLVMNKKTGSGISGEDEVDEEAIEHKKNRKKNRDN
jgi:hypothetical protein